MLFYTFTFKGHHMTIYLLLPALKMSVSKSRSMIILSFLTSQISSKKIWLSRTSRNIFFASICRFGWVTNITILKIWLKTMNKQWIKSQTSVKRSKIIGWPLRGPFTKKQCHFWAPWPNKPISWYTT